MEEAETDEELEQAAKEVERLFLDIVDNTRRLYQDRNRILRARRIKVLKNYKQGLGKQLARLGIRAWRPIDIAWDYVMFYNDKIRQLWSDCNKGDPDEKGRVMRQIADLIHKRYQGLAEVDQLPDCPILALQLPGWVESEYFEALRPLETEAVDQPDPVEQPESVVTQLASRNIGFLDHVSDGSEPIGDYDVPKADLEPTSSREVGEKTSFETAFEITTSSQTYNADPPSLDAFEKSLFATPSRFEPGEDINDDDDSIFGDPDDNDSLFGDPNDDDSLFGDANNYQIDPTPVSCQTVQEAQPPENTLHVSPTTQQAFKEKLVKDYNSGSVPRIPDRGSPPKPATAPSQAAEVPLICGDNNTITDASINQQVSQEQQAVRGLTEDNDFPFSGEAEEADGPFAEPKHGTETQLGPGVGALPTQESGIPFDQGLGAAPLMPGQPGLHSQAAPGAEPVQQVVLAAQEAQQSAGQSKVTSSERGPPPFVTRYVSKGFCPTYQQLATEMRESGLEFLRRNARDELRPFWPHGRQACTNLQLDLYATGVEAFKKEELERYERCFQVRKPYVVEFLEEYEEIPPNKTLQYIFNGIALFNCLIDKKPEVVDLTEDDSISSTMAASFGVPEPTLSAPEEVLAAGEPVSATADEGALNGDETPQDTDLAPKRVSKIHTPPPVDQATFTQGPVLLTGNVKPTTPMQNDSVGSNGAWSSGWSGKAFSDGGEPPRTPSNQDVVVMERSVSTDNTKRKSSTTDKTVVTKRVRANTRAGAGSGSFNSTQRAHAALQDQLSQSAQAAGPVHGPLSASPGPMAGPSTAEPTERGNKRRKKNAEAAADTDASLRQQHSTPEQQPAQYYGPSPEQSVDAKKWVEDHAQGGKGKKSQKRKATEPKKTPTPRKARKTKEATPTAPRSYRNIAPAPARNHDDANDVQMQSRENTPMGHTRATRSSPHVQIPGNGTQILSAARHMPHGQPQQMPQQAFQNLPQQQYFQPPVGQQNGWTSPMQQQQALEAQNSHLLDRVEQLRQQVVILKQQTLIEANNRRIAELEQQAGQPAAANSSQLTSYHSMPQGNWQSQQQSDWPSSLQGNVQPQSHGMVSHNPYLPPQGYLQYQQWQSFPQQMSQPPMATPLMMSNQGMVSNGTVSRPTSMHEGYWQGPPPAGNPMARPCPQNGYQAHMNFNYGLQGDNTHGMHGGFNGGASGNHTEERMTDFGY